MFDYNFADFVADAERIQKSHPNVWNDLTKLCRTINSWIENGIPVDKWPHTKVSAPGGNECHYLTTKLRIAGMKGRPYRVFYAYYPKDQYFKFIQIYMRAKQDTFDTNRLEKFELYIKHGQ